jgi:hypothetical protein
VPKFFYSGHSELPILYAIIAILTIETFITHIILEAFSVPAAYIASGLGVIIIALLIRIIYRLTSKPHALSDTKLIIRPGKYSDFTIPLTQIKSVAGVGPGPITTNGSIFDTTITSHPNIILTLTNPITRRKYGKILSVSIVYLKLDKPSEFTKALILCLKARTSIP